MSFFSNLFSKVKEMFGKEPERDVDVNVTKQNISNYQNSSNPHISKEENKDPVYSDIPSSDSISSSISDVIEHKVERIQPSKLDVLADALLLNRNKIVYDRDVVVIPFDASGCDFDTKRQLAAATALEYGMDYNIVPGEDACAELAKKMLSCLKGVREESFTCGALFASVSTDVDDDGFVSAEITNVANGKSVMFDIPSEIAPDGRIDADFDLIYNGVIAAREKVSI